MGDNKDPHLPSEKEASGKNTNEQETLGMSDLDTYECAKLSRISQSHIKTQCVHSDMKVKCHQLEWKGRLYPPYSKPL